MIKFIAEDLRKLWVPRVDSQGEDNGQVTIIGGSSLFHGAPILSLKTASRIADMVFFASPEPSLAEVVAQIKVGLSSFIWVPWKDLGKYIEKSDAVLIGPGLMRFKKEGSASQKEMDLLDGAGRETRKLTRDLLSKFPHKKWVIDGGSLQVMDPAWIPKEAIVTPNRKEWEILNSSVLRDPLSLIKEEEGGSSIEEFAKRHHCVVVQKGAVGYVSDGETTYEIDGGNAGLTHGGTGDVLAGVIVGLLAKNPPLLAAAAGSLVVKKTAEELAARVGYNFNADDVAEKVFEVMKQEEDRI